MMLLIALRQSDSSQSRIDLSKTIKCAHLIFFLSFTLDIFKLLIVLQRNHSKGLSLHITHKKQKWSYLSQVYLLTLQEPPTHFQQPSSLPCALPLIWTTLISMVKIYHAGVSVLGPYHYIESPQKAKLINKVNELENKQRSRINK